MWTMWLLHGDARFWIIAKVVTKVQVCLHVQVQHVVALQDFFPGPPATAVWNSSPLQVPLLQSRVSPCHALPLPKPDHKETRPHRKPGGNKGCMFHHRWDKLAGETKYSLPSGIFRNWSGEANARKNHESLAKPGLYLFTIWTSLQGNIYGSIHLWSFKHRLADWRTMRPTWSGEGT